MKQLVYILFAAFVAAAILPACNTTGCINNQSAIPLAGFYSSSDGKAITLSDVAISGVGALNDSLLVVAGSIVKNVYLPMRSQYNTVSWCLHYDQEGIDSTAFNDTITFGYESLPFFASEECGAMYYYDIKSMTYTTHLIDSVAISDSLITNVDIERIHIYFRTADEPVTPPVEL